MDISNKDKLKVLSDMAGILNKNDVAWAVGGSLLLYLKGKTDSFRDIDVMVCEGDALKAYELLLTKGTPAPPKPDGRYMTKYFFEFTIDGVDIDVIAGFVIVKDGIPHDCSLLPGQIVERVQINGEMIPLQALADWRRYYILMGRMDKVEMIDG